MRHVPIAEFKDRLSEMVSAAEDGEEIVITRHGREVVKLVAAGGYRRDRQAAAIDAMIAFREELRAKGVRVSRKEIREWIDEGRR